MTSLRVGDLRIYPRLAGPKIWFRGETLAATLSDGDPVTFWPDISGNDYHADTVIGTAPTFRAADLNGLATVEFPGGHAGLVTSEDDLTLQGNAPLLPRVGLNWTVLAVFLTDDPAADQYILNGDDQTSDPPLGRASQFMRISGPDLRSVPRGALVVSSGQSVVASTWHLGESWQSDTQAQVLLDGAGNAPIASSSTGETGNNIYISHVPAGGSRGLNGKIAEIIGWGRLLDTGERTQWITYLQTEYGL